MKILLFGKNGLLGSALLRDFSSKHAVTALSRKECDVTNEKAVQTFINQHKPQIIINATGYTAVDKAEEEKDMAFKINSDAVEILGRAGAAFKIPIVHFSTDYVFDGENKNGYLEKDAPSPISVYGASKAAGEQKLMKNTNLFFLIRTAWLYGPDGKNFVDTMINLSHKNTGKPLEVVNDQIGSPTLTLDLAQAVLRLLETKKYGIYHLTNDEACSWYEFACEIFHQLGVPQKIVPITSEKLNRPAKRPHYSILINSKLPKMRHWKQALESYLQEKTLIL